jgi:electron transport complex protein RnfD
MWLVAFCAALGVAQSALADSFSSLIIALAAVAAAVLTELAITAGKGHVTVQDGSAAASALVFSLLLPNTIHPVLAALGAVFAMAVVKHSFGGLGANWLNPALGGWLFVRFSWPGIFEEALGGSPLSILSENFGKGFSDPLAILKINGWTGGSLDGAVTALLNKTVFSVSGTELPSGYIALFLSPGPGIIADRSLFIFLLGTVVISAFQVNRFLVPLTYLGVYALLIRIFGALPFGGAYGGGDVLFGFCTGGTMAAAFLLLTDPATGPKSPAGAVFCALAAGIFTFLFRYGALEPYGAFFAAALVNALVPLVRRAETWGFYSHKRRLP